MRFHVGLVSPRRAFDTSRLLALLGFGIGFVALGAAFSMGRFMVWQPCSLCWVQRGCLLVIGVGLGYRGFFAKPCVLCSRVAFVGALGGLLAAWFQYSEVASGAPVCPLQIADAAPNCAIAGAHLWLGFPLAAWGVAIFLVQMTISTAIEIAGLNDTGAP